MDTRKYQKIQVYGIMPHPSAHYTLAALPPSNLFSPTQHLWQLIPEEVIQERVLQHKHPECNNILATMATEHQAFTSNLLIHVLLFFPLTPGNPVFQTTKVLTKVD